MNILTAQTDFTQGSIIKNLITFSLPIVLGELLQNLYNSVDALVVGNLISESALAAVMVSGTISNMVVNFFNGMSVGANVVVSVAFGRKDTADIQSKIRIALTFSVILGIVLSFIGILLTPRLLRLAGAQEEYYTQALTYLRIYLAGILFTVIYNNGAGVLRALGDSGTPFRILLLSCCSNIVLDFLFVGILQIGVVGVGLATIISQGISVILVFRAISKNQGIYCLDIHEMLSRGKPTVQAVRRVGISTGLQSALIGFSNIFIMRYVNIFNTAAVAGVGIAQRLDKFIVLPVKSFGITMTTFMSQNIGAGSYERIRKGKVKCLLLSLGVTSILCAIFYVFLRQSVAVFNSNPDVVETGIDMLRVLLPFFWLMAVREIVLGILRGYGKNFIPMLLGLTGMIGIRQLFLAISMHYQPTIENIYVCYPISWFATTMLLICYYMLVRRKFPGIGDTTDNF